jgi:hypothetical protein
MQMGSVAAKNVNKEKVFSICLVVVVFCQWCEGKASIFHMFDN